MATNAKDAAAVIANIAVNAKPVIANPEDITDMENFIDAEYKEICDIINSFDDAARLISAFRDIKILLLLNKTASDIEKINKLMSSGGRGKRIMLNGVPINYSTRFTMSALVPQVPLPEVAKPIEKPAEQEASSQKRRRNK